jgi:hypothetical protein
VTQDIEPYLNKAREETGDREALLSLIYDFMPAFGATEDDDAALADAIRAIGFRRPRVIETVEELEKLPVLTVVLGADLGAYQRQGKPDKPDQQHWWERVGFDLSRESDEISLPATVVFMPESER